MQIIEYTITDPLGIHARPAGRLVKEAMQFQCDILIEAHSGTADAKRILSVMGLGITQGTRIQLLLTGEDEQQAAEALGKFLQNNL